MTRATENQRPVSLPEFLAIMAVFCAGTSVSFGLYVVARCFPSIQDEVVKLAMWLLEQSAELCKLIDPTFPHPSDKSVEEPFSPGSLGQCLRAARFDSEGKFYESN